MDEKKLRGIETAMIAFLGLVLVASVVIMIKINQPKDESLPPNITTVSSSVGVNLTNVDDEEKIVTDPKLTEEEIEAARVGAENIAYGRVTELPDYDKTITNIDPLVLSGDETLEITDTHYIIANNITLQDNALLIIRNSHFEHRKEHAFQYELKAEGNSKVIVENSILSNQCNGSLNWAFFDNADLTTNNVRQSECNLWNFFSGSATASITDHPFNATVCDQAQVTIDQGKKMEIELCYPDGVVVDQILPNDIDLLVFPNENDTGVDSLLTITNSTVDGWGVGVSPNSDIIIRDTPGITLSIIVGLPWQNQTVTLDGLDSKLYEDKTWQIADSTLRLVNTTTYGWEPNAFGTNTMIIRNSNYSGNTNNSSTAKYIVENSISGQMQAQESVEMIITNSTITGDVIALDNSNILLIDSTVGDVNNPDSVLGNIIAKDKGRITLQNTSVLGQLRQTENGAIITQ
jgi:hypothetical protein